MSIVPMPLLAAVDEICVLFQR